MPVVKQKTVRTLGLSPPPGKFPVEAYDKVNQRVSPRAGGPIAAWHAFASAWNAIVYRLLEAHERADTFSESIAKGDAPEPQERFRQEQALFDCFAALQSSIECTFFASQVVTALSAPSGFAPSKDKDLNFSLQDIVDELNRSWQSAKITSVLNGALLSPQFKAVKDLRRVLFHRGSLPRQIFLTVAGQANRSSAIPSNPADPADRWCYDRELTPSMLTDFIRWADDHVAESIISLDEFTQSW